GNEVESPGHFLAHSVECRTRHMVRCRHQQIQVTFGHAELSHCLRGQVLGRRTFELRFRLLEAKQARGSQRFGSSLDLVQVLSAQCGSLGYPDSSNSPTGLDGSPGDGKIRSQECRGRIENLQTVA